MRTVAGILLLISGIVFPMGMLIWLNGRLNRRPGPAPAEVGVLLALNGVLPVALLTLGVGLISARLWAAPALRVAMIASWLATAILGVALAVILAGRGGGAGHGR